MSKDMCVVSGLLSDSIPKLPSCNKCTTASFSTCADLPVESEELN